MASSEVQVTNWGTSDGERPPGGWVLAHRQLGSWHALGSQEYPEASEEVEGPFGTASEVPCSKCQSNTEGCWEDQNRPAEGCKRLRFNKGRVLSLSKIHTHLGQFVQMCHAEAGQLRRVRSRDAGRAWPTGRTKQDDRDSARQQRCKRQGVARERTGKGKKGVGKNAA